MRVNSIITSAMKGLDQRAEAILNLLENLGYKNHRVFDTPVIGDISKEAVVIIQHKFGQPLAFTDSGYIKDVNQGNLHIAIDAIMLDAIPLFRLAAAEYLKHINVFKNYKNYNLPEIVHDVHRAVRYEARYDPETAKDIEAWRVFRHYAAVCGLASKFIPGLISYKAILLRFQTALRDEYAAMQMEEQKRVAEENLKLKALGYVVDNPVFSRYSQVRVFDDYKVAIHQYLLHSAAKTPGFRLYGVLNDGYQLKQRRVGHNTIIGELHEYKFLYAVVPADIDNPIITSGLQEPGENVRLSNGQTITLDQTYSKNDWPVAKFLRDRPKRDNESLMEACKLEIDTIKLFDQTKAPELL